MFQRWRQWDWIAAQRVDAYVANSQTTKRRVARYFGREATVLHPPVDVERFTPAEPGEAYVVLSELMAHKRIDVAVRAFNELRLPLAGRRQRPRRAAAAPAGRARRSASRAGSATRRRRASSRARRALVVTATEEFGIAAVEAQAAGRPVIALHDGGVRETVIEGETGVFFDAPEPESLAEAVLASTRWPSIPRRAWPAPGASTPRQFRRGLRSVVERALDGLGSRRAARRRPPRRAAAWRARCEPPRARRRRAAGPRRGGAVGASRSCAATARTTRA